MSAAEMRQGGGNTGATGDRWGAMLAAADGCPGLIDDWDALDGYILMLWAGAALGSD
jgi:hypothetical protein